MKVLTGLVTALIVSISGLVLAPAANAAPYPHTVPTDCHARLLDSKITTKQKPSAFFRITTQGNYTPSARVTIRITRNSTGRTVERAQRFYNGGTEKWTFSRLGKGTYTVSFRAQTADRSVFKNCNDASFLRVTR